jgi:hypothetical protein
MQMSCINSKAPQAIQPMNPIALGLASSPFAQMGMMMADPNNPAQMALLHDRQKQLYQQQLNHHGMMAMAAMHNPAGQEQQGGNGNGTSCSTNGTSEKPSSSAPTGTSTDVSSSTEVGMNGNQSAMSVFQMQQRQYYAMLMAPQQQMAAMAAGNPAMMAQQQQMGQFQQPVAPQSVAVAAGATEGEATESPIKEGEENAKV